MTHIKPLPCSNTPLHRPPSSVKLHRWGGSISLSLVLLACGGVADLKLGKDTSALQGENSDDPSGTGVAPGTSPSGGTPVSDPTAVATPHGVFLVDPATGQLYAPCSVGAGAASDEPPALDPATAAATAPAGTPVTDLGTGTAPSGTPVAASGTAGTSPDGTAPDGTSVTPSGTGIAPDGTPLTPSGTQVDGRPATDPAPTTAVSASGQPCGPVGYAVGGVPVQAPETGGSPADGTQPAPVAAEPATAPAPVRRTY